MKIPNLDNARQSRAITGLARNPAAILPVLRELMHIRSAAHTMAAHRGKIPDDLARALLGSADPVLVGLLDRDDRVSPAMRRWVADNLSPSLKEARLQQIREWVSRDTRVSLDDLEKLAGSTAPATLSQLAAHSDWHVRRAVAQSWFDAPESIRRTLLADPEPEVRAAACRALRPRPAPAHLHLQLLSHPATRALVADYVALSSQLAAESAADEDEDVRAAVAINPNLPAPVCEKLAVSDGPWVRASLIINQATPEPLRARLHAELAKEAEQQLSDAHFASWMLWDVRWLREMPLEPALAYLDSPYPFFRSELARRKDLPVAAVAQLDCDPNPDVRRNIARRPDAPGDLLERVVRECGGRRPRLVEHPNFPRAAFARFAVASEPRLRALGCRDPQLSADLIAQLARDSDWHVRASAAGHPNLSAEDAVRLLDDEDLNVVEAAAASPALPPAAVDQILAYAAQFRDTGD